LAWQDLVVGGVIGWLGHVAQVKWADRREEKQLRVTLGNRASAVLTDVSGVWKDIQEGKAIDERRIQGLESGISKIEGVLERVTVIRDARTRDRLMLWHSLLRGLPDDVRLFNDRSPLPNPGPGVSVVVVEFPAHAEFQAQLLAARGRIERIIADGQEFQNWIEIWDPGPGAGLDRRVKPQNRS